MTRFVIAAIETEHLSRPRAAAPDRPRRRTWVVWEHRGSARPTPTPVIQTRRPV